MIWLWFSSRRVGCNGFIWVKLFSSASGFCTSYSAEYDQDVPAYAETFCSRLKLKTLGWVLKQSTVYMKSFSGFLHCHSGQALVADTPIRPISCLSTQQVANRHHQPTRSAYKLRRNPHSCHRTHALRNPSSYVCLSTWRSGSW